MLACFLFSFPSFCEDSSESAIFLLLTYFLSCIYCAYARQAFFEALKLYLIKSSDYEVNETLFLWAMFRDNLLRRLAARSIHLNPHLHVSTPFTRQHNTHPCLIITEVQKDFQSLSLDSREFWSKLRVIDEGEKLGLKDIVGGLRMSLELAERIAKLPSLLCYY